jgi:ABC-type sugar transport system ATPase subunit
MSRCAPVLCSAASRGRARRRCSISFKGTVGASLHPDAPIRDLPPDEKQIVEILKAWSIGPRLLILDEATASLDSRQVGRLFALVDEWKRDGLAIVFVSHRMEEIFRVADRAVVLRNGHSVGTLQLAEATERDVVNLMIGRQCGRDGRWRSAEQRRRRSRFGTGQGGQGDGHSPACATTDHRHRARCGFGCA